MTDRRVSSFMIPLFLAGVLSGCAGLSKGYPEIRQFTLDPVRSSESAQATHQKSTVALEAFTASPACEDAGFLLRRKGSRVEKDYYNRFITSPSGLVQDQTAAWLRASGLFAEVRTSHDVEPAGWVMAGHVLRLEGDFGAKPPCAVMAIQFTLTPPSGNGAGRFFKSYEQRVPLTSSSPEALAEGWNSAFAGILASLESDLASQLGK